MTEMAFMLLSIFSLLAFLNWRHGFALSVLMAIFQDPLRKLLPNQPVYLVIFVGVVFGAALVGALLSRVQLAPGGIVGWRHRLGTPFTLFVILALFQAGHSLISFGNPVMTGIGLISYLAPIPAIALAYRFALSRGESGVRSWMRFYVLAVTLALATVYLEYAGLEWRVLGEVGKGVWINGAGGYYRGNSGIFRAAEIAAWHASTVACFGFMLFRGRRFSPTKLLVAMAFVAFLVGIGALTGRRKMIIEIAIFLCAYVCLIGWFQRGNARFAALAALIGVASYTIAVGMMPPDQSDGRYAAEHVSKSSSDGFGKYSERAQTVFGDVPGRVVELGVMPVSWAIASYGVFGAGLGVGSQGVQHFGVKASGAAEGGLGKLTVELGMPGLVLAFWLLYSMFLYIRSVLSLLAKTSPNLANLAFGIVAFMIANVAAFSVAAQAYGDIFVLLSLGWSLGFLMAMPVLADAELSHSNGSALPPQVSATGRAGWTGR